MIGGAVQWSLYASFSLPVSLMLLCDLPMLPRYMSEAVSVAVFTMLAGAACLIGPADFSNRMVEKNLVAIAAYVLLPALAATAWLRTCHPMADSLTRNLRWIFGAAALAVLLAGSFLEWQAPVVMGGAIVLALHVVVQAWPWIAIISRDFWWIWLLVGGIILIAAAARYEASLKSVQSLGKRILTAALAHRYPAKVPSAPSQMGLSRD